MVAIYKIDKMDPPGEESCLHIWRQQHQGLEWTLCLLFSLSRVTEPLLWYAHWLILSDSSHMFWRQTPMPTLHGALLRQAATRPDAPSLPGTPFHQLRWSLFSFLKTHTANCLHISPCSEEETNLISMNTFMNIWKKVCPFKNMSVSVFFHWIFLMKLCFKLTWRKLCTSWETIEKIYCNYYTLADINPKQGIHLFSEREWIFFLYSHISEKWFWEHVLIRMIGR